jgi:hypothetical protein
MRWQYLVMLALAGCPGSDEPPARITVDTDCLPLYVPTFENVYDNTLRDTCGSTAVGCHSAAGQAGGMSFEDQATAHAELVAGRVTAGDPGGSEMIVRVASAGADYQMPPRAPAMDDSELCALVLWVQDGAQP